MLIVFIALGGYIAALIAINRNKGSDKRSSRINFAWYAVPYLTYWVLGITRDLLRLNGNMNWDDDQSFIWSTEFFIIFCAAFAYPLYRQIMWRINDCGSTVLSAYISLIPFFNALIIFYLLVKPTRIDGSPVVNE